MFIYSPFCLFIGTRVEAREIKKDWTKNLILVYLQLGGKPRKLTKRSQLTLLVVLKPEKFNGFLKEATFVTYVGVFSCEITTTGSPDSALELPVVLRS